MSTTTTMITPWQKNLEMAFDEINDTGDNDVACFAFTPTAHKTFPSIATFSPFDTNDFPEWSSNLSTYEFHTITYVIETLSCRNISKFITQNHSG